MAKDKSKNKGGKPADDEFGNPSEAPSGGDGWKLTDAKDRLLLITPLREEEKPAFGKAGAAGEKSTIIVADVVVIDLKKPERSEEHENVWIFQRYIQGSIRGFINDRKVLGWLRNTEDTSKAKSASGGYYWELEDAGKADIEAARAYQAAANDPFRSKKKADEKPEKDKGGKPAKGGKSKAAPEPSKKGKGKKK